MDRCPSPEQIWHEFTSLLKQDTLELSRIRPYHIALQEPIRQFLGKLRKNVIWIEFEQLPKYYPVLDQVHFIAPLTLDGEKESYCFSFLIENENWYLQHIESIIIPIDPNLSLPVSIFPDLPASTINWIRSENHITEQVRLFNYLLGEKGKQAALDWFRDGAGYFLASRTWIPFIQPAKAFLFYLCWEQTKIQGNPVTLHSLDDENALIKLEPVYFKLYRVTGHLKQLISPDDYLKIFETIWEDRADHAGWNLQIEYQEELVLFYFKKKS